MRTKDEILEHLDKLFKTLGKYPCSQAISDRIANDLEELQELEEEL